MTRQVLGALALTILWTPFALLAWCGFHVSAAIAGTRDATLCFIDFVCPQWRPTYWRGALYTARRNARLAKKEQP